jgi:hypothetical protein
MKSKALRICFPSLKFNDMQQQRKHSAVRLNREKESLKIIVTEVATNYLIAFPLLIMQL